MEPVSVNSFDVIGDMVAAEIIAFGAAVGRSAAGTLAAMRCTADDYDLLGIADIDLVEKTEEGFYSKYDVVPVITAGRVRVWVTANNTTSADIVAGDYLDLADISTGTNTLPVGVLEESGSQAGGTRLLTSVARALEDVDLENDEVVAANVAVGDTTVTMTAGGLISKLAAGDYILLSDLDGNSQINRVKSVDSTTQITLQIPSTVALTASASDVIRLLKQCEVLLL